MGANSSKTRQIPCPPGVKPGDKIQRQTGCYSNECPFGVNYADKYQRQTGCKPSQYGFNLNEQPSRQYAANYARNTGIRLGPDGQPLYDPSIPTYLQYIRSKKSTTKKTSKKLIKKTKRSRRK